MRCAWRTVSTLQPSCAATSDSRTWPGRRRPLGGCSPSGFARHRSSAARSFTGCRLPRVAFGRGAWRRSRFSSFRRAVRAIPPTARRSCRAFHASVNERPHGLRPPHRGAARRVLGVGRQRRQRERQVGRIERRADLRRHVIEKRLRVLWRVQSPVALRVWSGQTSRLVTLLFARGLHVQLPAPRTPQSTHRREWFGHDFHAG